MEREQQNNNATSNSKAIIVSDLHLGVSFSLSQHFKRFLKNLPEEYDLILNGDVVHVQGSKLNHSSWQILERIKEESFQREVVWVRGNHDNRFRMSNAGNIQFKHIHTIGKKVLITHGDVFDRFWGRNPVAFKMVYLTDAVWKKLGGKDVNLARLARSFTLYSAFSRHLMRNAVQYARRNGFAAVICGHTHYSEDTVIQGIRYINTGCWTEWPPSYLVVNDKEMNLKTLDI